MQHTYLVFCWACCEACKNKARTAHAGPKRYAIIGGGFAGAATAHYLAATASVVCPVTIHLYDIAGLVSKINVLQLCLNPMGQIVSCPVCRPALPITSIHVAIHICKDSMWSLDIRLGTQYKLSSLSPHSAIFKGTSLHCRAQVDQAPQVACCIRSPPKAK